MSGPEPDRFRAARAVADAVLYEGYILYPYRASATKNQFRWQFGVLSPPTSAGAGAGADSGAGAGSGWGGAAGSERCSMRTECLLRCGPGPATRLHVRVRFLQAQHRAVEAVATAPAWTASGKGVDFTPVTTLEVAGEQHVAWDESIEHVIDLPPLACGAGGHHRYEQSFGFPGESATELLGGDDGGLAGRIVRRRQRLDGRVGVDIGVADAAPDADADTGTPMRLLKVGVTVENRTECRGGPDLAASPGGGGPNSPVISQNRRDQALEQSLIAVHTMLAADDGSFVSLLDPPDEARLAAADCHSDGCFPVLIGAGDVVLSSPIILYDYPQVAPESPGDLYDATEIDEILALRVVTLTEGEKSEARGTDPRAAAIIDRCDEMTPVAWERLHGSFRPVGPAAAAPAAAAPADAAGSDGPRSGPVPASGSAAPAGVPPTFDWPLDPVPTWGLPEGAGVLPAFDWSPGATPNPTPKPTPNPTPDSTSSAEAPPWWDPAQDASVDPWTDSIRVGGVEVHKGTAVRLRPWRRCDAQDLFLGGRPATVAGVFTDVDGHAYVAVTVDDDPAAAELVWQGRYLFFHPDEVEPRADRDGLQ